MTNIHKLKIEPMTPETFAPFGEMMAAKETPADHRVFFPVDFQADGKTTMSVIWQPKEGITFTKLERHFGVTQSFVQLSGSPAVVAVASPTDPDDPQAIPRPEDVHAFLIDPARGFAFSRGTWHSLDRFILAPPGATFLILNSNPNPTQFTEYLEGHALTFTDLGTDQNPTKVDLKKKYDLTFEISL